MPSDPVAEEERKLPSLRALVAAALLRVAAVVAVVVPVQPRRHLLVLVLPSRLLPRPVVQLALACEVLAAWRFVALVVLSVSLRVLLVPAGLVYLVADRRNDKSPCMLRNRLKRLDGRA